jgi:Spy/CpxP family protein refolding chaperone
MMKRIVLVLLVFMFVLPPVCVAKQHSGREGSGQHGKDGMDVPRGKWWKLPQMAERLDLAAEEKEKLDLMFLEHRRQMIDLRSAKQKERLELEHLLDSTSLDSAACMRRFVNVQEAQKALALERFRFLLGVREILGLDRFQQLKTQVREHRMKRRHMGRDSKNRRCSGG